MSNSKIWALWLGLVFAIGVLGCDQLGNERRISPPAEPEARAATAPTTAAPSSAATTEPAAAATTAAAPAAATAQVVQPTQPPTENGGTYTDPLIGWCSRDLVGTALEQGAMSQVAFFENRAVMLCAQGGPREVVVEMVQCGVYVDRFIPVPARHSSASLAYLRVSGAAKPYTNTRDTLQVEGDVYFWSAKGSREKLPQEAKFAAAMLVDNKECGAQPVVATVQPQPQQPPPVVAVRRGVRNGGNYVTINEYNKDKAAQAKVDAVQDGRLNSLEGTKLAAMARCASGNPKESDYALCTDMNTALSQGQSRQN